MLQFPWTGVERVGSSITKNILLCSKYPYSIHVLIWTALLLKEPSDALIYTMKRNKCWLGTNKHMTPGWNKTVLKTVRCKYRHNVKDF
uniref:Ovule protein n=1 Tax=Heterorhabditis bacteriophora TaxID=37862 RepID=A0A1I7W6I9_HETBA